MHSLRLPSDRSDGLAPIQCQDRSCRPLFDLPVRRTCLPSHGDRQAQTGDLPIPHLVIAKRGPWAWFVLTGDPGAQGLRDLA